ncbi:MAG: DUF1045 domain-containing protein, partial [Geminicoccaceae bacterium]
TAFEITLEVDSLDGFTALVPAAASPALDALAADCVDAFDGFRAPLDEAVAAFACERAPFEITLNVGSLGGFIAFVPAAAVAALDALAADCVEAFDGFRAPLDEAAIARRRAAGLTPRQDRHLLRYGYPYVLDDFRFHMTLTERLRAPERDQVLAILADRAADICAAPLRIDAITVFEQLSRAAPFTLRRRFPFARA